MSCRQGQAYSEDLRQSVLAAVDEGMPAYQAAKVFKVSLSYVYKALDRRRTAGEVSARAQRSHLKRKLVPYQDALRRKLGERNDVTLKELRAFLAAEHGIDAAIATIHSELKHMDWTRKKKSLRAAEQGRSDVVPSAAVGGSGSAIFTLHDGCSWTKWAPPQS